jgi:acetyltransferase-like isoleucine patch superfamily enzyme
MAFPALLSRIWHDGRAVLRAHWYFRKAELGKRVRVWGRPAVSNYGQMRIADSVRLVSTIATTELVAGSDGLLDIGQSAFINYGCSISATRLVRIGARCNIGTGVIIMDSDFHRIEPERRTESPEPRPIVLEENVWLGARVIVLGGVTIGAGSVIGAGSIVTRDIPPRSVAVGQPAKVVRTL